MLCCGTLKIINALEMENRDKNLPNVAAISADAAILMIVLAGCFGGRKYHSNILLYYT